MTPWFAPRLSPYATRLILQLGHKVEGRRGSVLVREDSRVTRVFFVKSGMVARSLVAVGHGQPLAWSIATTGALCGGCQNLYSGDHFPRRHWTLKDSEILEIPHELLLKIADRDPALHHELAAYCERSAMSDKLGMVVTQIASNEERLRTFLAAALMNAGRDVGTSDEVWIRLPSLPRRREVAKLIGCSLGVLDRLIVQWVQSGELRRDARSLWLARDLVAASHRWLQRLVNARPAG